MAHTDALTRARTTLRRMGRPQPFHHGDVLMAMGADSHEVLLIDAGAVKAVLPSANGDVLVGLSARGMLVGELGVLECRSRSATVVGIADGIATHLAGPMFRDLVERDGDVRRLADVVRHQRLRNADRRQVAQATMNVRDRTIFHLLDWARSIGQPTAEGVVLRGLSQRDLAAAVLASVQHVEAALHALRADGLIDTGRKRFVLIDPTRLAHLMDDH